MSSLTKLKSPTATHISLVARGANGIPFKVLKTDKTGSTAMFSLDNLVKRMKGAKEDKPSVEIMAVASNHPDTVAVEQVLKGLGLSPIQISKSATEGNVFTIQELGDEADVHTVQISDSLALVVKGFSPWADNLVETGKFSEVVQAQNFFTGIYNASDTLRDVLRDRLYAATDKVAARSAIAAVLNEYTDYVLTLVDGLPDLSFKMDKAISEIPAPAAVVKADTAVEAEATPAVEEPAATVEVEVAPEAVAVEVAPVVGAEGAVAVDAPAPTPTEVAAETNEQVTKSDTETMIELITKGVTAALTPALEKMQADIQEVVATQEADALKLTEVESLVTKTDLALGTNLRVSSTKGDKTVEKVAKADSGEVGPIDTAYKRNF